MGAGRVGVGPGTVLRSGLIGGVAVATAGVDLRFGVVVARTGFVSGCGIAVARTGSALRSGKAATVGGTGLMSAIGKGVPCAPIFIDGLGVTRL